jgi:hypothetical protein
MPRGHRTGALLPLAGAVLLLVTACTAAPAPTATPSPAASVPPFPAASGAVLSASGSDVEWHRTLQVDDATAAYEEARRLLVDGGFTLTKDRQGTGGGDGQACTTELCVGFTANDIPGKGPRLVYDVFRPTGIVDVG